MLRDTILKLQTEFILEATSSPNLFQDMAKMEMYMAESYNERVFIELLQNADDAHSTKMKVILYNNDIYVANNGKVFSDNDIYSICRSGSSTKVRGENIGYRGVGFKSTSYLSDDIIIYSDNVFFTFSKEKSSKKLNVKLKESVPTIRIPFLLEEEEIDLVVKEKIKELTNLGYETIFIFKSANSKKLVEELADVNSGYFLFLHHINFIELEVINYYKKFFINRYNSDKLFIENESGKCEKWLIISNTDSDNTKLCFKLDENERVVECSQSEAVFHCYLPTVEKTGLNFKINGDFSTDPSRKHLVFDRKTEEEFLNISSMIFDITKEIVNDTGKYDINMLRILNNENAFYKYSIILKQKMEQLLSLNPWIKTMSNYTISTIDLMKKPNWLEISEYTYLRNSKHIQKIIPISMLNSDKQFIIEQFIEKHANKPFTLQDGLEIIREKEFVEDCSDLLLGKLLGFIINELYTNKICENDVFKNCYLKSNKEVVEFNEFINSKRNFSNEFQQGLSELILPFHMRWFQDKFKINNENLVTKNINLNDIQRIVNLNKSKGNSRDYVNISREAIKNSNSQANEESKNFILTKSFVKWRAVEEICLEIEKMLGNKPKDVSKQNVGYDIESINTNGEKRYVEVKFVKDRSFSLTNNEYTTAHQYADKYYLCIIQEQNEYLNVTYIKDPINVLTLTKRIRQWEWYCEEYDGETFSIRLQ